MIAEGNNEILQSFPNYIMEADDFYSQNPILDIIAAHLKILWFEKNYFKDEDPRRQTIWFLNPFVQQKQIAISHEGTL
jgi:hypothetical protein